MRNYCTLFDFGYAAKGLALHESLMRHSSEPFMLHILAMDVETMWLLDELQLPNVNIVPIEGFEESMHMRQVRESRSWPEYCWTAASNFMQFLLNVDLMPRHPPLSIVPLVEALTYLDADLFFFADPELIFREIGDNSIGITPHRFTERTPRHVMSNGKFNVGVLYARNDEVGRDCISRWAEKCRDWCYAKVEADRFGDQKYLDLWPLDYRGHIAIIEHPGINLGPWALANYEIRRSNFRTVGVSEICDSLKMALYGNEFKMQWPLIAYHFHEYRDPQRLTGWPLRPADRELVYAPYSQAWLRAKARIEQARRSIAERRNSLQHRSERA